MISCKITNTVTGVTMEWNFLHPSEIVAGIKTTSKPTAKLLAREASLFLEILATGQAYCEPTKDYELTIRPKYANDKLSTF